MFNKTASKPSGSKSAEGKLSSKYLLSRQLAIVCALDFEPFGLTEPKRIQEILRMVQYKKSKKYFRNWAVRCVPLVQKDDHTSITRPTFVTILP